MRTELNTAQWTAEQHPHPATFKPAWFCVAPKSAPLTGHPGRYPFNWVLPDGRRAYHFIHQESAQRAADRANTTSTED